MDIRIREFVSRREEQKIFSLNRWHAGLGGISKNKLLMIKCNTTMELSDKQ